MTHHNTETIRHAARDGTVFWVDATDEPVVRTNRPNTYLANFSLPPRHFSDHIVLTYDGHPIELGGNGSLGSYGVRREKNLDGSLPLSFTWVISDLGPHGDHFLSREQQDASIALAEDILKTIRPGMSDARYGRLSPAKVEFTSDFLEKLDTGFYILK